MQPCPNCGTPLPDKASFCAHCGYALKATDNQASQTPDTSEPLDTLESSEKEPEAQAFATAADTQQGDETQVVGKPIKLILPSPQDILPPAETDDAHEETHSPSPDSPATPLPIPTDEDDVQTMLAFPAFAETPLPTQPTTDEEKATLDPQVSPQTPLPAQPTTGEEVIDEEKATLNPQIPSQTPLPTQPTVSQEKEALEPQMSSQVSLPALPETSQEAPGEEKDALETLVPAQIPLPAQPTASREESTLEAPVEPEAPLIARPATSEEATGEEEGALEAQALSQAVLPVRSATGEEALNKEEDALEAQVSPQTALPARSATSEEATGEEEGALEAQALSQAVLPAQPETSEEKEALETLAPPKAASSVNVPTQEKASSPASVPSIEEQETRTLPPPAKKSAPSRRAEIAEQETRTLPPPAQKSASNYRTEIAEQETLAVFPAMPKTPLPRPGTNKNNNHPLIEAQKTLSLTAAERAERSGTPGGQSQTEAQNNGTTGIYRGNQQNANATTQVRTLPPAPPLKPAPKTVRTIGGLLWGLVSPIFKRARDPEPEKPKEPLPQFMVLGWLPVIALVSALGLFTTSTAFNAARDNTPGAELYYWLGLGLIYIPIVVRLILPHASRAERVGLLCVVTLCLFLTKVSLSPLYYSGYDEFLHWRTINDILSSGHLFTKNTLLPVSPFYPGLEIVTSALSNISGLSSIQAGFTVVGVANLITILSLFLLAELLSGSARLASIAAVIYMANPHFLFFDTQFAYESLAIPLALVVMLVMTRYETLKNKQIWAMLAAWTVLVAMDLTHHATNFVFEGLFLLWAIVYLFLRPQPLRKSIVFPTVLVGLSLTVGTIALIGNLVITYFSSFFTDISSQIARDLGTSGGSSRQLFGGGAVIQTPLWERLISLGSVGLITLAIPFLLLCFWRRYRRNTLIWVFAIIIVFYPVLQVLRLTTSGAEISDRASAFVFIAISFLGAVAIVQFWPVRLLNWRHSAVISAAILVLFMGGIILGEGIPPTFMPGPYEASADSRSIDAEGIQAALWAYTYLGPNQRTYTDRVNQLLMSVYGDQYLVTKIGDNVDVTDVIFDPTFSAYEISRLQKGQVHYLAIDLRLSTQLPQDGFYYEQGESTTGPNGDTTAINRQRLTKFDGVPQINRLFDSGNMVIYDTGGIINAPAVP